MFGQRPRTVPEKRNATFRWKTLTKDVAVGELEPFRGRKRYRAFPPRRVIANATAGQPGNGAHPPASGVAGRGLAGLESAQKDIAPGAHRRVIFSAVLPEEERPRRVFYWELLKRQLGSWISNAGVPLSGSRTLV